MSENHRKFALSLKFAERLQQSDGINDYFLFELYKTITIKTKDFDEKFKQIKEDLLGVFDKYD